jgi:RNA polymerase sigma-70 factor (ECF subfamily)
MSLKEDALLRGARRLDRDTLAAIYEQYSPEIYRYAFRLLGDGQVSEDCVADTFSRFLKVLSIGEGPNEHLRAYLYRIAHNWITDSYRRNPPPDLELKEDALSTGKQHLEIDVEMNMEQARVRSAMRALTPDQRQVVTLRYLQGFSHEEIAASMEKEVGAIKALQHRALDALKRMLLFEEQ